MKIEVKLKSIFSKYQKSDADGKTTIKDGGTVLDLVRISGLPEMQVRLIAVNGKQSDLMTALFEGDMVFIFPPAIGGG